MKKRRGKVVTFTMTNKAANGIPVTIELPDGSRVEGTFCTVAEGRATLEDRAALKVQLIEAMNTGQEIEIYEDE